MIQEKKKQELGVSQSSTAQFSSYHKKRTKPQKKQSAIAITTTIYLFKLQHMYKQLGLKNLKSQGQAKVNIPFIKIFDKIIKIFLTNY